MNSIVIIGRLTRDPEMKFTPQGTAVTTFTLAVDRGGDKGADFIPVKAWQKTAELCAQYLNKGNMCAVAGRLSVNAYEAKDGTKRTFTEVVANSVQFLTPKGQSDLVEMAKQIFDVQTSEDVPF